MESSYDILIQFPADGQDGLAAPGKYTVGFDIETFRVFLSAAEHTFKKQRIHAIKILRDWVARKEGERVSSLRIAKLMSDYALAVRPLDLMRAAYERYQLRSPNRT